MYKNLQYNKVFSNFIHQNIKQTFKEKTFKKEIQFHFFSNEQTLIFETFVLFYKLNFEMSNIKQFLPFNIIYIENDSHKDNLNNLIQYLDNNKQNLKTFEYLKQLILFSQYQYYYINNNFKLKMPHISTINELFDIVNSKSLNIDNSYQLETYQDIKYKKIELLNNHLILNQNGKKTLILIKNSRSNKITNEMFKELILINQLYKLKNINFDSYQIYFFRFNHYEIINLNDYIDISNNQFEQLINGNKTSKNKLNKEQEQFVNSNTPILCLAGPGSGKTHTLTEKILIDLEKQKDLKIEDLLILTFTNMAGMEIKNRITSKFGLFNDNDTYIGTFHSIFFKLLKENLDNKYEILTPNEDIKLFFTYLKKHFPEFDNLSKKNFNKEVENKFGIKPYDIYKIYLSCINQNILQIEDIKKEYSYINNGLSNVIDDFFTKKEQIKKLSFNDILRTFLISLTSNYSFRHIIQTKFKYIYVDEKQDTNTIQYEILKNIQLNNNLILIGDPFQSIYGFLDANFENIYNFKKEFNPNIIELTKNYRSNKNIVELTNQIRKKIKVNLKLQDLEFVNNDDIPIEFYDCNDMNNQIVKCIRQDILNYPDKPLNEHCVIIRKNKDSKTIEQLLLQNDIPFMKLSGSNFYDTIEVQTILSLLKFYIDRTNIHNLSSFVEEIVDGINTITIHKLEEYIKHTNQNEVVLSKLDFTHTIFDNARKEKLKEILTIIERNSNFINYDNFLNLLIELDVINELKLNGSSEIATNEINENCIAILEDIEKMFEQDLEHIKQDLEKLNDLLLEQDKKDINQNKVIITTAHSSKGLEFENVYLYDVGKNNFTESFEDGFQETPEQLRLLYVAISRTKNKLLLFKNKKQKNGNSKKIDVILEKIMLEQPKLFKKYFC